MPRIGRASARVWLYIVLSGLVSLTWTARSAAAQSLVSGALTGEVRGTDDSYVSGSVVTIVNQSPATPFRRWQIAGVGSALPWSSLASIPCWRSRRVFSRYGRMASS